MFITSVEVNSEVIQLVYHTADGGDNWNMQPDSIKGLQSTYLHAPDANTAWAVANFGKVFKGTRAPMGIEDPSFSTSLKLYPNPANNELTIVLAESNANQFNYAIINLTGATLRTGNLNTNNSVISIHDLPSGIYFISVTDISGANTTKKFTKL